MKKKALAWILALSMTLSTVNPIFAADMDMFSDSVGETQEELQEETLEEPQVETQVPGDMGPESESAGEEILGTEVMGTEEAELTDASEIFGDDESEVFSSGEIEESEAPALFSAGDVPLITTESTFDVTADANGVLAFDFKPGKTGVYVLTITNDVVFWEGTYGIPTLSDNVTNWHITDNKIFKFEVISEETCSIKLNNVKPNQLFSFKWKYFKAVKQMTVTEDSKKIIEKGVIKGSYSWSQAIECVIHYEDGTKETIGNGKESSGGYKLAFSEPQGTRSDYRLFLGELGWREDAPELYVDVPVTEKSLSELGYPALEMGGVLTKADFTELYAGKFYCFSVTPEKSGMYALKISDAWCLETVNNTTHERIDGNNVFRLEQGNTYAFVLEATNENFTVELNETKEITGLRIKNPEVMPSVMYQGMPIDRIAEKAEFVISYSSGEEETVPFLWHGQGASEQAYHVNIDWDSIRNTVPGIYKPKFYISELGNQSITYESKPIEVKAKVEMPFPYIEAGKKYTEQDFQEKWNGRPYCLFTPTETARYLADCSKGNIRRIFNVNTGVGYGNDGRVLTEGETYCFELEIYSPGSGDFNLRLNKVTEVTDLELLNPEAIPSKALYKDSEYDYLSGARFRITYQDGSTEEISFSGQSADGLRIGWQIENEDRDEEGNLKPGKRTIKFILGNYGSNEVFVNHEIEIVENIDDLQLPTLQIETVYDKNNFSCIYGRFCAGKFSVSEDGIYRIIGYDTSISLIDSTGKDVQWITSGYSLKKGTTYLLKCYPHQDSLDNWKFKIQYIPVLNGAGEVTVLTDLDNEARLIFKPSENGVYKINLPENILVMDENGYCQTDIEVSEEKGASWRMNADEFSLYFHKDKTYEIRCLGFDEDVSSFKVFAQKKKMIKKLEIVSGLDELPREWIFDAHPNYFGMDALRFRVTFDGENEGKDGEVINNVKLNTPISSKEGDEYTVYTNYISYPPNDVDDRELPGEYKIEFSIGGVSNYVPEVMPDPITMTVKSVNELQESEFQTLEVGRTYSSQDYIPNYWNGKQFVFLLKPEYTGIYDFSEMYNVFSEIKVVGEDGRLYNPNQTGLKKGEKYAVIAGTVTEPGPFSIKKSYEITGFAFADPKQAEKLNVIGELSSYNIFNNVKFVVEYFDGAVSKTEEYTPGYYPEELPNIKYDTAYIYPTHFTVGTQPISFYLDGLKDLAVNGTVSVVSLKDMAETLPEIKAGTTDANLPDNYNFGKCFNFKPVTDGTYLISFSDYCSGSYVVEKGDTEFWGGKFLQLEAKANTLYTIYACAREKENPLKISAKKVSKISKLEVIQGKDKDIQWPDGFGEPDAFKAVTCRITTENGQTEDITYGKSSADFGELRYEFVDEDGNVLDRDYVFGAYEGYGGIGRYRLRFYVEGMPEVKSDIIWCDLCRLKDMGYTKLALNKNVKVQTPFVDFSTEYTWGTLFTPNKTQEYLVSYSDNNVEDVTVYDAETNDFGVYREQIKNGCIISLEANRTYAIVFTGKNKDSEIFAKLTEAGSIEKITLDTEELALTLGQTGTVIATVEPTGSQDEIQWSIEPESSTEFTLVQDDEENSTNRSIKVKLAENADAKATAILTAKVPNSEVKATCTLSVANIAAKVPKLEDIASESSPLEKPIVGLAGNKTGNGQKSDSQKTEQDLRDITTSISEEKGSLGALITPADNSSQEAAESAIKDTIKSGGSIITEVSVQLQNPNNDENDKVVNKVIENLKNDNLQPQNLSVEQKLNIQIEIKATAENGGLSKIGNITELPESKALTFTILLTQEQLEKKMYVAYEHGNQMNIIPEEDVTQKDGVMTVKANKFSNYYLVSSDKGFAVTYINVTPTGGRETEKNIAYGELLTKKTVSIPTDYTFLGWYDKDTGNEWNFDTDQVTGDITLEGRWQYNPPYNPPATYYTVKFDSQGGSAVASQSVTYGQKITEPTTPKREAYIFAGWYKDEVYKEVWDFAKDTVTASMTLYAKWEEEQKEPAQVTGFTYTSTTTAITLKWNKAENAEGYLVQGRTKGEKDYSWKKTIEKPDTLTIKNSGLKPGTVREYTITPYTKVNGEVVYGTPSEVLTAAAKPGAVSIKSISSKKGYVKVTAAKAAAGADGYEYAYSAGNQWDSEKAYKILGRVKKLTCTNKKAAAGVYAARVRAYKTVDGKRIYGKWSAVKWFEIPTGTLTAPQILKVKVNKNTVTVTLKNVKGATGFDCVLGTQKNPIKPTSYKYIKKNQKTTTIVFKKVKKGTYYVGAHAYKTTKGKKYFSKWSNQKKIVVK